MPEPDPRIVELASGVTAKRPRVVIDHIIAHGHITTEELAETYGYTHPPRAARDVREAGIPLETFRVEKPDGSRVTAYRFGAYEDAQEGRTGGRAPIPQRIRNELHEQSDGRCAVCGQRYERRYLQVDHRIPYQIGGDPDPGSAEPGSHYQVLCGSCQRAKSWSCEHCPNWEVADSALCASCYWAAPDDYTHIATEEIRRLDLTWDTQEISDHERLRNVADRNHETIRDAVKRIIRAFLQSD